MQKDDQVTAPTQLSSGHGRLTLPIFMPDATRASVRNVGSDGLQSIEIPALVVNAFHLMRRPGVRIIQHCGGIHRFMGWDKTIMSDSGGFQIYSLIRQNPNHGVIRPNEVIFRESGSSRKWRLTPEKSIQLQFKIGSDVMVCLDDCTNTLDSVEEQELSVDRTIRWARRCKDEFARLMQDADPSKSRSLIFAVIQGGANEELRRRCAAVLVDIGFDGYGFGGWPIAPDGSLLSEQLEMVSNLLPLDSPRHALGVGRPDHIVKAASIGYTMFDCSLPTRDARRNRLYIFLDEHAGRLPQSGEDFYTTLHILDKRYRSDASPVDSTCDCPCCRHYTRAYLHHLFKIGDGSAERLATLHNLRFYTRLLNVIRGSQPTGINHTYEP